MYASRLGIQEKGKQFLSTGTVSLYRVEPTCYDSSEYVSQTTRLIAPPQTSLQVKVGNTSTRGFTKEQYAEE
jgi:hypothetical protein